MQSPAKLVIDMKAIAHISYAIGLSVGLTKGRGGGISSYHEGAPVSRADVGFHFFVFKNPNIVLQTSLGHQ